MTTRERPPVLTWFSFFICAYLSYLTAEAVCAEYITGYMDNLGFSGVVASVVAGIFLAASVWPRYVQFA